MLGLAGSIRSATKPDGGGGIAIRFDENAIWGGTFTVLDQWSGAEYKSQASFTTYFVNDVAGLTLQMFSPEESWSMAKSAPLACAVWVPRRPVNNGHYYTKDIYGFGAYEKPSPACQPGSPLLP
jgi:hypothetical protein